MRFISSKIQNENKAKLGVGFSSLAKRIEQECLVVSFIVLQIKSDIEGSALQINPFRKSN